MKAAHMYSSMQPLRTIVTRCSTGSRVKAKEKKERKNKPFSAGCLIPVPEEDTVFMLSYQGTVGGWE